MRKTYWKRAFPDRFESLLTANDLIAMCADGEKEPKAKSCFFRIERGIRSNTTHALGRELLKSAPKGESWQYQDSNFVGVVWSTALPEGDPVGMIAFHLSPRIRRRTARIHSVLLHLELAMVHPRHRGRGYGRYLALGVVFWLESCRVSRAYAAEAGVDVYLCGDFYTAGGEAIYRVVESQFQLYREMHDEAGAIAWRIREFDSDAGF
jgi:GNAT superfamily N-acetyltransferase